MNRRVSLLERLPDEEFVAEVRAYLSDALPVDLLYRAAAALGAERDRDTARLKRQLERVMKDLRAAKSAVQTRISKEAIEDTFLEERLAEFDQVSKGRVALPQESVEALHGLLWRIADRAWREQRVAMRPLLEKWRVARHRGAGGRRGVSRRL